MAMDIQTDVSNLVRSYTQDRNRLKESMENYETNMRYSVLHTGVVQKKRCQFNGLN